MRIFDRKSAWKRAVSDAEISNNSAKREWCFEPETCYSAPQQAAQKAMDLNVNRQIHWEIRMFLG